MNRQIRLVGVGMLVLFTALFIQLNYLQVIHANSLDHNPLNGNAVVQEYTRARGDIVSSDGVTLAHSVPSGDQFKYLRQYPQGSLFAQLTGFFSFTYGSDGAERTYDQVLTGQKQDYKLPTSLGDLRNLLTTSNQAQSISLTVSAKMQQAAEAALGSKVGSVVAINPATGAILALYSNPSFDPNQLAIHNTSQEKTNYQALLAAPNNPLSPATYRDRWFPGSTFKILTSAAVFDHNPSLSTKTYPVLSALPLPATNLQLHNFGGETCGGQLAELFTVSCNTGFGAVGLDLGAQNLYDEAQAFGFNQVPPIDLPFGVPSNFPAASTFAHDPPGVAYSAIGQQDVSATPLQMALVASAIADNGTIMTPHILGHVTNSQGQTVGTYQAKPWLQATSASTAASITKMMESVVNSPKGTGTAGAVPGVTVAAKTGTAQTGTGNIDAWFAAFAPNPNPSIAVAVLVPNQPGANAYQGGTIAAPIAKAVIQAWLGGGQQLAGGNGVGVQTSSAASAASAGTGTGTVGTTP